MRFLLLSLLFLCGIAPAVSAQTLTGMVTDSLTGAPISFATVYFDGTTRGVTTEDDGSFSLSLAGIPLPAALVISHVNYKTASGTVNSGIERINVTLAARQLDLATATVTDRNQREKNVAEFHRLLLGDDAWGRNARILNTDALIFDFTYRRKESRVFSRAMRKRLEERRLPNASWSADGKTLTYDERTALKVTLREPLQVELPDLGYQLQLDLTSFQADFTTNRTGYLGYYFYRPISGQSKRSARRYLRNREKAFKGSSLHFLRQLANGGGKKLPNFRVYVRQKERGGKVVPFDLTPHITPLSEQMLALTGLQEKSFVILYYPGGRNRTGSSVQSGLLIGADSCIFRYDGTVGDSNLIFSGEMGRRGVAWTLPNDYVP